MAYQPVVSLRTQRLIATEALARWPADAGTPVPPDVFIPLAEELGLIHDLGLQVLEQACADAVGWSGEADARTVGVNVSPLQLRRTRYATTVSQVLAATGPPPSRLELEIIEGQWLYDDDDDARASLAIDDFGTGYASFANLERLPVDSLKIDRSFVQGLPQGRYATAIVKGVLTLAHELDLQVTAEGWRPASRLAPARRGLLRLLLRRTGHDPQVHGLEEAVLRAHREPLRAHDQRRARGRAAGGADDAAAAAVADQPLAGGLQGQPAQRGHGAMGH